jgi:hypothetical protein
LHHSLFLHQPEFPFAFLDPAKDFPAIQFQLRFSGATGTPVSTPLLGKVGPPSSEARKGILHPGQFHLEVSFPSPGPIGEDLEDHFLPVDHAGIGELFPVPLLGRGEGLIEHDQIDPQFLRAIPDLHRFARAHQVPGSGDLERNQEGTDHLDL